jgi:hypothetical protein
MNLIAEAIKGDLERAGLTAQKHSKGGATVLVVLRRPGRHKIPVSILFENAEVKMIWNQEYHEMLVSDPTLQITGVDWAARHLP